VVLARDAQRQARRLARDDLFDRQLVRRVDERVDQAHRDRLDAFGEQRVDRALGVFGIERTLDDAGVVDALVHRLAQVAFDQRRRLLPGEVVEARRAQGADFQDVAEALGGDQPDLGALVLDDGVRGDRGAVADSLDLSAGEAGFPERLVKPIDQRARVVVDAGGNLLGVDCAVGAEHDDVGERAANVDADAVGDGHLTSPWRGEVDRLRAAKAIGWG